MNDLLKGVIFIGIFLVPFLPVYVENDFFFPFITGKNFAFRIVVEIIFVAWALLALLDKKYRPKFSWLLAGFSALLIVMFFANLLGEYPMKSFWSNFERMDGYITLVHVFLLTVVMGSVMTTEKLWTYFMYVSTAVALFVALYGFAQMADVVSGGRARLDSRLGNAAYMAIYMLFHMFFVAWLAIRSKNWTVWALSAAVVAIFAYALLLTGTRGTLIGFAGGATLAVAYVALFGRKYPELRKFAIGGFAVLILLFAGFWTAKDSDFVQNSPLVRIANIDIVKDLQTRGVIWSMALDGVKERPVLGWGQGNFNYVFNQEFEPVLWNKEAWFDRVHNLVLDWLIAGGVLGFLAYTSIFVAIAYYLFYLPLFKHDERIDVIERAVLVGLVAGYLLHNMVVFDNIISYIFFACTLALIHFRVAEPIASIENAEVDNRVVTQIFAPVALVFTVAVIYFVNVPGMHASADIIDAMQQSDLRARLAEFHEAIGRGSFGDQEVIEQLAQQAMGVVRNPNVPDEQKQLIVQRAELELLRMIETKTGDARLHNFLATFYRTIGAFPQAQEQGAIARSLTPQKPAIILEQGVTELQMGNLTAARDFFQEAYDFAPANYQSRILLASTQIQLGNMDAAKELITDDYLVQFSNNEYALDSAYKSGDTEFVARLFQARIDQAPQNAQNWASLAYVYHEAGDITQAVATLEQAKTAAPEFSVMAQCFIDNMNAGNDPAEGCQ